MTSNTAQTKTKALILFAFLPLSLLLVLVVAIGVPAAAHVDNQRWEKASTQTALEGLTAASRGAEVFHDQTGRYGQLSDGPESFGATPNTKGLAYPLSITAISLNAGEHPGYVVFALEGNGKLHAVSSWGDLTTPITLTSEATSLPQSATDALEYAKALNLPTDASADMYEEPVRWFLDIAKNK